ncbi:MAG: transposase, partial [bacterium]|nr:transposase [bacterium]
MSDEYDSPWKDVLERYFPEFMAFFFPEAYREIDWSRGYESLDQELQQVVREAESGKRYADKLMKVWRLDGEELYVVIHIEIQGQHDSGFPLRMYVYNYRLFDRHQQPVASFAVLCDDSSKWRPKEYSYELWGCRASLRFPIVKLKDYNRRWAELKASTNPFALVVMSHLKARATHGDDPGRLRWKIRLVRQLYRGGWQRRDVLELFRFIDWVMKLP